MKIPITYYRAPNQFEPGWPILFKFDRSRLYCWKYIGRTWEYYGWAKYYKWIERCYVQVDESYIFLKLFESENGLNEE